MGGVPLSNVITICVALVSAAVAIGVTLGRLASLAEKIKSLERTRDLYGNRLETLEKAEVAKQAVDAHRRERRMTGALGAVGKKKNPGGVVGRAVHDGGSDDDADEA